MNLTMMTTTRGHTRQITRVWHYEKQAPIIQVPANKPSLEKKCYCSIACIFAKCSSTDRCSRLFNCETRQQICNEVVIRGPATSHARTYTTWWNIRKLFESGWIEEDNCWIFFCATAWRRLRHSLFCEKFHQVNTKTIGATSWVTYGTSFYILTTGTGSQSWWRLPTWSRNVDK